MSSYFHQSFMFLFHLVTLGLQALTWPAAAQQIKLSRLHSMEYTAPRGALYPTSSETRDVKTLDGIWNFRLSPTDPEYGYKMKWYADDLSKTGDTIPMPVPSSYNDITVNSTIRDHVGLVWYDRRFHVPAWWTKAEMRVWLRFSSVHYAAEVWVNGNPVLRHEIGHLPFEADITSVIKTGASNLLTVACDNILLPDTIPQGSIKPYPSKIGDPASGLEQTYTFDFFNYAGIHRSVFLYTTPMVFIDDIVVNTDIQGLTGFVIYTVSYEGEVNSDEIKCLVELFDKQDILVVASGTCAGMLEVPSAHLWWPYLMHPDPGYLYTLQASVLGPRGVVIDTYRQKIGIRTVTWSNTTVYLNDKPIYLRGFGMHEDSDFRGKGWDPALWVKNFDLIKWVGANAFRTSHYPYAEEIYQLADELGIMIIDECPSGDTDIFSDSLMAKHKRSLTELIRRDKNHPSVIMWSVSNEPRSQYAAADKYFGEVVKHVRSLDLSRPVTIAIAQPFSEDKAGRHLDIISFNRYNAWYRNAGNIDSIAPSVVQEAASWFGKYNKPVLMSEYGADTIAGLHLMPEFVWSEEYQVSLMSEHFKAFDILRQKAFFVGEFIWNFADFKTPQGITRVGGNKKGIFTRSRQPKASAHHLRKRYHQLAATDDSASLPAHIFNYVSDNTPIKHLEL